MPIYEIVTTEFGVMLKRDNEDGTISFIPMVAGNADYEEYLNPKAEQSTPNLAE